jgi:hypothetical protein
MGNDLTTHEAAELYGLSTVYIRKLAAQGRIKGRLATLRKGAAIWLIDAPALRAFMQNRATPGRPKKRSGK